MRIANSDNTEKNLKVISDKIIEYSEKAQLNLFLSCYDNSPTFLHFSSDGQMRNYEAFKKICTEYYNALKKQKVIIIQEKIHLLDTNLAVIGSTVNIIAEFKNGDIMKLNNYSITSVFKKINTEWKVIHSHESGLLPEIIKN